MNKDIGRSKQLLLNITSAIVSLAVSIGISFFLTPYIVAKLGVEANGFIGLSLNIIFYTGLITYALHIRAWNVITIKVAQRKMKEANEYFNSVYVANIVLCIVTLLLSSLFVYKMEFVLNIPLRLLFDVKLTFAISFINFIITTMGSIYSIAFFATNKVHIGSLRIIFSNILRLMVVVVMFVFLNPQIYYVALASVASSLYVLVIDIFWTKKLLPDIKMDLSKFGFSRIKELISSSSWITFDKLSQILISNIDLLLSNIFISASAMGILNVSKIIPNVIYNLLSTLTGAFTPEMTILYGKNNFTELQNSVSQATRILCLFVALPNLILIVYGKEFYSLWQPTQDSSLLYGLSVLSIISSFIIGPIQPLYSIFTIMNKVRENSIAMIILAVISIFGTLVLLKTTNLGLYSLLYVSMIGSSLLALCYQIPRVAILLKLKWYHFYKLIIMNILVTLLMSIVGYRIKHIFNVHSWITLILSASITSLVSIILMWFIMLNKKEREFLINKLNSRRKQHLNLEIGSD